MQNSQLTDLIHSFIPATEILALDLTICPINDQPEKIQITFREDGSEYASFPNAGNLMDKLQDAIRDDEYGDLTELTFAFTTYATHPDYQNDIFIQWTITCNIDS